MKKKILFVLICLFLLNPVSAKENKLFAGMRNERYAFIGLQTKYRFGMALENSVLVQKPKIQYVRFSPYYLQEFSFGLNLSYALYGGFRYDFEFFDLGARLNAEYLLHNQYFHLLGIFQPFYDSDLGTELTYLAGFRTFFLKEVGFQGVIKNLPEYRKPEHRVALGLIFKTERLSVLPEISTPLDGQSPLTRVSVSFLYSLPF
ncbi:MAG: hypothetical protein UIH18_02195 [Fibrobacteraceae bacterium]|nr:hypothetical protein [Fibrobacteraceae bacterium]